MNFHTIKSILNNNGSLTLSDDGEYFHTIKSILNIIQVIK